MAHNHAAQDEDMSMDEILASIRRYVTGDEDTNQAPSSVQTPPSSPKAQPRVVQLTAEDQWAPATPHKNTEERTPSSENLISEEARHSTQKSFQKMEQLRDLKNPSRQSSNGRSMDDFIIELLRPMLKQWMDKNLPILVERIVEREIQSALNADRV